MAFKGCLTKTLAFPCRQTDDGRMGCRHPAIPDGVNNDRTAFRG